MNFKSCLFALVLFSVLPAAASPQKENESQPGGAGIRAELLVEVVKETAKYAVAGVAGWLLIVAGDRWRTRRARPLFRPFLKEDLLIVVGRFEEFREWDPCGLIGVGDAFALKELQKLLSRMGAKEPKVVYADRILSDGDELKHPVIVLGGPDANAVTKEFAGCIPSGFRFGDASVNEVTISDVGGTPTRSFSPRVEEGRGVDYGLVMRAPNPLEPDKPMMILAGAFGYGTWAAVRLLASPAFHKESKRILKRPFEGLIRTEVIGDTPQRTTVVELRSLVKA
jgi:hypothetical protein